MTPLERWHQFVREQNSVALQDLLHEDVVFWSPVVHTPQKGRAITAAYLTAAGEVLGGEHFRYLREFDCGDRAVLEFTTELDGVFVNGVDMIEWDDEGRITDFKVMVRPLQAIQKVHGLMGEMLERMQAARSGRPA